MNESRALAFLFSEIALDCLGDVRREGKFGGPSRPSGTEAPPTGRGPTQALEMSAEQREWPVSFGKLDEGAPQRDFQAPQGAGGLETSGFMAPI